MKKLIFSVLLLITMSSYAQTSLSAGAGWNTDHYSVLQAGVMHNFRHFNLQAGVYTPFSDSKSKETLWHVQVGKEFCLNRYLSILPAVGYGHTSNDYIDHSSFVASTYLYADITRRLDVFGGFIYAGRPSYGIFSGGLRYSFGNDRYDDEEHYKRKYRNW